MNDTLRKTDSDKLYFSSDLNYVLGHTQKTFAIMNMDLVTYKENFENTGKKVFRFIESKHLQEKLSYWEGVQLSLLANMCLTEKQYNPEKYLELDVYIIYTNPTEWYYDKNKTNFYAKIIRVFDNKHKLVYDYNKFLKFCRCECLFEDLFNNKGEQNE